ncbi:MAG: hypothetical protein LBR35_00340 [Rickettsiales bacterium]|jgi:hypothetical protein|nr:hypothetical protein [Rickettsiales bacterium]
MKKLAFCDILIGILMIMLIVGLFPMSYWYYTVLKIAVFAVSLIMAFCMYNETRKVTGNFLIWIVIALLYNPILFPSFSFMTWSIINVITLLFFGYTLYISNKK